MDTGQHFENYETFLKTFQEYQQDNFSCYRIKTSETAAKSNLKTKRQAPDSCKYTRCKFVCTHYGEHRHRGAGIRSRTKSLATGCKSFLYIVYDYDEKKMLIKDALFTHNHPTTAETYGRELQVKRLDANQRSEVKEIVALQPNNEKLRNMLFSKYGKKLSLKDVRHLKSQLKRGDHAANDVQALLDNVELLEGYGKVQLVLSQIGDGQGVGEAVPDIIAFSSEAMLETYHQYPGIIFMDALWGVGIEYVFYGFTFGIYFLVVATIVTFLEFVFLLNNLVDVFVSRTSLFLRFWDCVLWLDDWKKGGLYFVIFSPPCFVKPAEAVLAVATGGLLVITGILYMFKTFKTRRDEENSSLEDHTTYDRLNGLKQEKTRFEEEQEDLEEDIVNPSSPNTITSVADQSEILDL